MRTRVCTFELDPRGFVRATVDERAEFTLEDAREALSAIGAVGGPARRLTLVDMRRIKSISREGRDHFRDASSAVCSAVAMLVESPVGRVIGNFFLRTKIHGMPNKLFNDDEAAIAWLLAKP